MFLSIFAATCRTKNIIPFLKNVEETADDPTSFEVLIKLDEGADELVQLIEEHRKTCKIAVRYLVTPKLEGYYTLDVGYNELLKIAHPDSYFCWLLTDEIRLETKGWDTILKNYIGFYPDDIFRIKLSIFQSKNYIDFFECLPCPDNYAVTTRKWLEITGGWGHFWGPDSWHQCVDYYLGLCKNDTNPYGIWRSFPIFDIKVGGQEAGQGIEDEKALRKRVIKIWTGWNKHSTHAAQENFYKLAHRLNAHIHAQTQGLQQYLIQENLATKTVSLFDASGKKCYQTGSYRLPLFKIQILTGYKALNFWKLFPQLFVLRIFLVKYYRAWAPWTQKPLHWLAYLKAKFSILLKKALHFLPICIKYIFRCIYRVLRPFFRLLTSAKMRNSLKNYVRSIQSCLKPFVNKMNTPIPLKKYNPVTCSVSILKTTLRKMFARLKGKEKQPFNYLLNYKYDGKNLIEVTSDSLN